MSKSGIVCAGCGVDSSDCGYDDEFDSIKDDGSYAFGKFVCDACYGILIEKGKDVGSAALLQQNIVAIMKGAARG